MPILRKTDDFTLEKEDTSIDITYDRGTLAIYPYMKTRFEELLNVTTNYTAPFDMVIPNDQIYTVDGQSLEIFHNRIKLIRGVDYQEIDNKTVRFLINIWNGDYLLFRESYGFSGETSIVNADTLDGYHESDFMRIDKFLAEHNVDGWHSLPDQGSVSPYSSQRYRFKVINGSLVLETI